MQEVIKKLTERLEKLKEKHSIAVVYHFDVDGCASASLLWRYFQMNNIGAKFFPATRGFESITIDNMARFQPDKIILVDYIPGKELINFMKNYDSEILDHHTHEDYLDEFDYYTTADDNVSAAISYTISKALENLGVKNTEWLQKVGSFWDKTIEQTEHYYEGVYEKELDTMLPFNLIVNLTHLKGSEYLFEAFNSSSDMEDALENVKMLDDYKRADEIFKSELREIEFSRKEYPTMQMSIYWVNTKFKHIRVYVDYISYQKKGTKVFIIDEKIRFKFSIRTSLDINLVSIIREIASENKNFSGGGHPQACGALLLGENVEEVIDSFIEKYKKTLV